MPSMLETTERNQCRILLHSQRGIYGNLHYRLGLYEFEDIIRQVDSVDMLAPQPRNWFKYGTRIANRLAYSCNTAINPGISKIEVQKDYDLFFVVAQFPKDLLHIEYVKGWKDRCKTSICWINEIWVSDIADCGYFLKILSQFDYVIVHWAGSVNAVQEAVQGKCSYLPYGIDALLFCPYPNMPRRVVDVYSIGRKSEETHQTFLKMAENNDIFYVYDTIAGTEVIDPKQHRLLLANMAKRSRYFVVNPGKRNIPGETGGQVEFGNRFFEGAAAGTIMIGETPHNEQFAKVFGWPDAVIHLPFGSRDIVEIINELDKQPERQAAIRKTNVIQSLRHHDWVYRWEKILDIADLDPLPALLERKKRLEDLSKVIQDQRNGF